MKQLFASIFLLCSLSAARISEVSQPVPLQMVKLGESANVACRIKSPVAKRVWYKLNVAKRLQLVAVFHSQYTKLADEFSQRFSVAFDRVTAQLNIFPTTWDDVGTYYCGVLNIHSIQFGEGTSLVLQGPHPSILLNVMAKLNGSSPEGPGDPVNVAVHSAANASGTCLRSTTSCMHELLARNLGRDGVGTFHCAVTPCGETLFGDGTGERFPRQQGESLAGFYLMHVQVGAVKTKGWRSTQYSIPRRNQGGWWILSYGDITWRRRDCRH